MDANKYTKKSLEAVQNAQNTAMEYGNAELTCTHLADALLEKDGMCYRILRRANCDADGLSRALHEEVGRLPRVSGSGSGQVYAAASLARLLIEAERLAQGMKDV